MFSGVRIVIFAAFVAASPLVYAYDVVSDDNSTNNNGYQSRFKIFTAEHQAVTNDGKVVKIQSIFKIDLENGTVWRYRQGIDQKGKPYEEFFEVPNQ